MGATHWSICAVEKIGAGVFAGAGCGGTGAVGGAATGVSAGT
ncbi:hypothetical protein BN131_433 [Cronobacter malonaticus 681]|nr:hypothetical protein BN131_433 [Cronobacter malonaticus 681]